MRVFDTFCAVVVVAAAAVSAAPVAKPDTELTSRNPETISQSGVQETVGTAETDQDAKSRVDSETMPIPANNVVEIEEIDEEEDEESQLKKRELRERGFFGGSGGNFFSGARCCIM